MLSLQAKRPLEILLVEDNPGDARLVTEAFNEDRRSDRITVVGDGMAAMEYLKKEGQYGEAPRPDIIFLDLNLPKMDGREVLQKIKSDKELRLIPVLILTTSSDEDDILHTYHLHANCYLTKPIDFDRFVELVREIHNFWLNIVMLPSATT